MQIGKVVGTVVSTQKDYRLEGLKLLIVKYTDLDGTLSGSSIVAADSVGAGIDELVLVATGSSARQTDITKDKPVDAVIMAIVDIIEVNGKCSYKKNEAHYGTE